MYHEVNGQKEKREEELWILILKLRLIKSDTNDRINLSPTNNNIQNIKDLSKYKSKMVSYWYYD